MIEYVQHPPEADAVAILARSSRHSNHGTMKVLLRAEFFNITNRANFNLPNPIIFSGNSISPSAGKITSTTSSSRQIQFGLKLMF